LYNPINSQTGIQESSRNPAITPPATKLFQVRNARMTRTALLQNISNELIPTIYNEMRKG
jgi:hypothetical protein